VRASKRTALLGVEEVANLKEGLHPGGRIPRVGSNFQPGILEVQLALDASHDVVVDLAAVA
jgi:hypothetical protein